MLHLHRTRSEGVATSVATPDRQMLIILNPIGFYWLFIDYANMESSTVNELAFSFIPFLDSQENPYGPCISKKAILKLLNVVESILE